MLRFNPDAYTDYNGIKHPSCFKFNPDTGTVIVNPTQKKQWITRCNVLIAAVTNYLDPSTDIPPPEPDRVIFSQELFYDNISAAPDGETERARARLRALGKKRKRERESAQ